MSNTLNPSVLNTWRPNLFRHPLFLGYEHLAHAFGADCWPTLAELNSLSQQRGITNSAGLPIRFSDQATPKGQRDYEMQVHTTGCVPTRPQSWHDFFNAGVWLTFPKLKAALNTIHCAQPEEPRRTAIADAATVFDESGAILIGPNPELAQWLRAHDWRQAFVTQRSVWKDHRILVVGHSVLEKTLQPYPGMIAKVTYLPGPTNLQERPELRAALRAEISADETAVQTIAAEVSIAAIDLALAKLWLAGAFARPRDFFAVPVLGVPGVDPANESPDFYNNIDVFRPAPR
jgi:hypothetical protein